MPDEKEKGEESKAAEMPAPQPWTEGDGAPAGSSESAAPDEVEEEVEEEEEKGPPFFIVGIGASAGGLEALGALLKLLSLESMALVVVQHLAPHYESALPALLSRTSKARVLAAEEGMKVEPSHIYVIPPNADLAILNGVLHLMPPSPGHGVHLPIDYFFRSLAQDKGSRSIGIVLSGTGTDGTFGLKAIKEAGGITFVQDPTSAKYDGMPRSALDSGWADFCLGPEAMADALLQIARHSYLSKVERPTPQKMETVGKLLVMMRTAYGNDLTYYKPTMVDRRVERRMALHKIEKLDDYIKFALSNPGELDLLYKDMLIGVTSFFRDHDPFEALKTKVFPAIMEGKEAGSQIRIWVPACSTGEEAYSLAICLLEYLGDKAQDYRVQIFGTDIDQPAIQHARHGIYPQNIALDVSPERLHRFFVKREAEYHISRRIRDMVVFSVQNVTKDPPFSRVDMATCRNLLIYLIPMMQKRVLRILHYSLLADGFLMLGTSETVGESADLFSLVDRTNKIYARKHVEAVAGLDLGFGLQTQPTNQANHAGPSVRSNQNIASLAERKVLEMYGPPGVVITGEMEIVHIRGHTGPYLEPMAGAPSFNLMRLARPELHVELRRTIHEAQSKGGRVSGVCKFNDAGTLREVDIEVIALGELATKTRFFLVLFQEPKTGTEKTPSQPATPEPTNPEEQRIQELERELLVTKEYLQSTIEELESANEELKSSNEEMQSSNEELQSTNEELETSKEELQSSNEELTTVNDELQDRMAELQQSNDDLHNVLRAIGNAVVIVGMDLRIRRYTETAGRLMNLIAGDVGRSVGQLNAFVVGERLEDLAAHVVATLTPVEREVICADQRWYLMHITPYRTLDHAIKGAVISLLDIDSRRRGMGAARDVAQYAQAHLTAIDAPMMIVDSKLRIRWLNAHAENALQLEGGEAVGAPLDQAGSQFADARLIEMVERLVATGTPFKGVVLRATSGQGGQKRTTRVSGGRIPAVDGDNVLLLLSFALEDRAAKE
ncbi:MAG TPA: chemotaxis protein CheB [Myxococcales bacterium]|nr:chemotaxis protein CheB [Myxococcales bacterium]